MKPTMLLAAALFAGALFASGPEALAKAASDCCAALAACCEQSMDCCP